MGVYAPLVVFNIAMINDLSLNYVLCSSEQPRPPPLPFPAQCYCCYGVLEVKLASYFLTNTVSCKVPSNGKPP